MSPEQAQGKAVDARSDVFSLGILLFEMATGEKPFKGDTHVSLLSAILKDTPSSLTDLRQDLPREVGRILTRCLAKDPDDRYQTAKDLRNDLALRSGSDLTRGDGQDADQTLTHISQTVVVPLPRAEQAASRWPLAVVAAVAPLPPQAGGGTRGGPRRPRRPAFSTITMRRLTNTGKARIAAISPDGRYVVHDDGSFDKPGLVDPAGLDGEQRADRTAGRQVNTRGWRSRPMARPCCTCSAPPNSPVAVAVSDSGAGRAAPQAGRGHQHAAGILAGWQAHGVHPPRGRRSTGHRARERGWHRPTPPRVPRAGSDTYADTRVAWSPDGTLIAAFAGEMPAQRARIVLVNVETGREQEFSDARFDSGGPLTWLGDGSALVFDAIEKYGGRWNWNSQLWSVAYPAGTLRRITPDVANYLSVAATAGGRTLVAVRDEVRAGVCGWRPTGDTARARPITDTRQRQRRRHRHRLDARWPHRLQRDHAEQLGHLDRERRRQPAETADERSGCGKPAAECCPVARESSSRPARRAPTTSWSGRLISTAATQARSKPAAAYIVDTSRPSGGQSISRLWRRTAGGLSCAARRRRARAAVSPIRPVCLRASNCAASLQTNAGRSGPTWSRPAAGMAVVPIDGTAPVRTIRLHLHAGRGFRWHLGAGRPGVRRPGLPRWCDQPLAVPARRLRTQTGDGVRVGADPELPLVTRREDPRHVARDADPPTWC